MSLLFTQPWNPSSQTIERLVDHVRHIYVRGPNLDQPTPRWRLNASRAHTHTHTYTLSLPFLSFRVGDFAQRLSRDDSTIVSSPRSFSSNRTAASVLVGFPTLVVRFLCGYAAYNYINARGGRPVSHPCGDHCRARIRFRIVAFVFEKSSRKSTAPPLRFFFFFFLGSFCERKERKKERNLSQTIWKIITGCTV